VNNRHARSESPCSTPSTALIIREGLFSADSCHQGDVNLRTNSDTSVSMGRSVGCGLVGPFRTFPQASVPKAQGLSSSQCAAPYDHLLDIC
jgi:hypothetical protein